MKLYLFLLKRVNNDFITVCFIRFVYLTVKRFYRTGSNDIDEHNDDMQFISESTIKKEQDDSDGNQSDEPRDGAPEAGQVTTVRKPASASLLNSYRQTWKATHNHYLRYSDVRPKDERRPTIMDLANQYRVQEKVNGWKIYHLSTQMEDLVNKIVRFREWNLSRFGCCRPNRNKPCTIS
jgi:hypothetical protein